MSEVVPAHDQKVTHSYRIHFPPHPARKSDPHYAAFRAFHRRTRATAKCSVGLHRNDYSECDGQLELHHHIEFALQQGLDIDWVRVDFPDVKDEEAVAAWIESETQLIWLCLRHHRGDEGVHVLSAADWEAMHYVKNLIAE